MKKTLISFDLDGTIVKPDYNEFIWFKEIPELYAKKYGLDFEKAREKVIKEYEKVGDNDVRWYSLDYWLKHFGFGVGEKEILEKYAPFVELYPEVISVLEKLKRNYILVISSAMGREFINVKLRKEKIFKYFNKVFSAISDFGMIKKEVAFYRKVCQSLDISPSQLIHVGDNYEADYLVPRNIGIRSFYLNRTGYRLSNNDDSVVSDLKEFVYKINNTS